MKWRTISILAIAGLLAMSLWFSASAVVPVLMRDWGLTPGQGAWLTTMVQIGFVAGALVTALTNLADIFPPSRVFAAGAIIAASANAAIPLFVHSLGGALPFRFLTGFALAAVYPVGMKIMATWTKEDRGLGIGLLVGALAVGSASPHFVRGLGGVHDWRPAMVTATLSGLAAAVLVLAVVRVGPYYTPAPRFRWRYIAEAWKQPGLRLANYGYLGHMWELYAMWTWVAAFLAESYRNAGLEEPERWAAFGTFGVIAMGGAGSVLAGIMADRWGRTRTTILSMLISGACSLGIGFLFGGSVAVVTAVALVWGFAIVADSAQFSTAVSELCEREYVGSALATQTAMGFLLTMVSIQLLPRVTAAIGWRYAFAVLAIGPALGVLAMWRLRQSPEATRLAGGRG